MKTFRKNLDKERERNEVVLAMGLALGLINGYMIAYLRIHPLIMTLAMSYVVVGIIVAFAQGRKLLGTASPVLKSIANGKIGGFHVIIIIWVVLTLLAEWILRRTKTGQKLLSIGANETAATLSGVNVPFFRLWVYGFSGALSAASLSISAITILAPSRASPLA